VNAVSSVENLSRDVTEFFSSTRRLIDAELDRLIPKESQEPRRLHSAIRWSMFAGGKRFRPALVIATGEAFGTAREQLLRTACAFEMIHTYSLIHDDLPSMDDDDLRRGQPTCHVKFDEATAILAGDALQALAFQTIAEDEQLSPETRIRVAAELARAAGTPAGMVSGQARDLEAESKTVAADTLQQIHLEKTGALICAAARCGATIGGASGEELNAITDYATNLGLLFQITDDLLDVTATAGEMGKTPGKDARSRKATYPAIHGLEATRAKIEGVHTAACGALERLKQQTDTLRTIADFVRHRET
jgi:geranylgeranyl diphosphate synthase, type II